MLYNSIFRLISEKGFQILTNHNPKTSKNTGYPPVGDGGYLLGEGLQIENVQGRGLLIEGGELFRRNECRWSAGTLVGRQEAGGKGDKKKYRCVCGVGVIVQRIMW